MQYRVAPDTRVVAALARVFDRRAQIASQSELTRLVRVELEADDPLSRVSGSRVRRLALDSGVARLDIRTRRTMRPLPSSCPVCGGRLQRRRNRTLSGGETVVGARCTRCPYHTGARFEEPTLYVFHARRRRTAPSAAAKAFPVRGRVVS